MVASDSSKNPPSWRSNALHDAREISLTQGYTHDAWTVQQTKRRPYIVDDVASYTLDDSELSTSNIHDVDSESGLFFS